MIGKKSDSEIIFSHKLQEESQERKCFMRENFKVEYTNSSKIFLHNRSPSADVKVNNYLCYQEGQNLCKVTEIIYEDKIIRIEDRFEVEIGSEDQKVPIYIESHVREKNTKKPSEKVRIFGKSVSKNNKKDKKNIVKNIIKMFLSWLEKDKDLRKNTNSSIKVPNALTALKELLSVENFNNRLIKKVTKSKEINKSFLEFLTEKAKNEIRFSRIQDKESHYEAIELYIHLLSEDKNEDELSEESYSKSISEMDGNSAGENERELSGNNVVHFNHHQKEKEQQTILNEKKEYQEEKSQKCESEKEKDFLTIPKPNKSVIIINPSKESGSDSSRNLKDNDKTKTTSNSSSNNTNESYEIK